MIERKVVLITGGAGYIGSHTTLVLLRAGYKVLVLDNLSNSSYLSLKRVSKMTGTAPSFVHGDVRDRRLLDNLFRLNKVDSVIHFAGLKAVGESVNDPLSYYSNNTAGTVTLCQAMAAAGVCSLIFSSSATVYGNGATVPINEEQMADYPTNPYGRSKRMIEQILFDLARSNDKWSIGVLRYFNPVGAHESGLIGEDPLGVPNNLLPYLAQVALGKMPELPIFGDDYETHDGTGVRDYIHVMDLAEGHLSALTALETRSGVNIWNLGTGKGYSVLEVVQAFEAANGCNVPYRIVGRRPGDIAVCYADPSKAARELGWHAKLDLTTMMRDTWRWQTLNPNGYRD
ncbi:MAG: UDP-glucose 4-epimerase GalE [Pseudohongiella sp.]|nr:UDP-glucose 4-epimerase GalE [Pseudohongiella sp.]